MKRDFLWAALVLALAAVLAVACGDDDGAAPATSPATSPATQVADFDCNADYPGTPPDSSEFPLQVTDDAGETVAFEAPPEAIVSLSAAHVEVLYAIGAAGQLVAGDLFSDCPQAAAELEQVDSFQPSVEAITALNPDLVLMFYDPGGLRDSLEGNGITVLSLTSPESVLGVLDHVELLGEVTGHAAESEAVAASMEARIDEIVESLPEVDTPPKVYHEVDNTFFSAGPGSFVGDMYDLLEAENIANPTGEPFPQLSQEAIIAAAPDVIILADEARVETPETVKARPGWDSVPAVQNDRIYPVDPSIVNRPGPRVIEALETLAGLLYER